MAVAFDAATLGGDISNLTSRTFAHTCTGSDRFLIVCVGGYDAESNLSGVTVTYGGVAMSKLGGNQDTDNNNTILFGLINPASGANNVVISNIPASYIQAGCAAISFSGVHQTTPTGLVQNGVNVATVNVPSMAADDMAFDLFYDGDNDDASPTTGTKRFSQLMASSARLIGSTVTGTGTVGRTYSGVADPMISALRIIASASAVATFIGALQAQSPTIGETLNIRNRATGAIAAQAAHTSGVVNRLHVAAPIQAQAAQINSVILLAGAVDGGLVTSPAVIAADLEIIASFTGSLLSGISMLQAVVTPEFIFVSGNIASQQAVIDGEATIIPKRPPRTEEIIAGRFGYRRRFNMKVRDL